MSFKKELAAEVAALKAKAAPKKHRYKNGYRKTETIRLYCRPSLPKMIHIRLSYDLVDQMWRWRDKWAKPHEQIPDYVLKTMRIEFLRFEGGIPGCLMRLEQPYHYAPNGVRIHRVPGTWMYALSITHKKVGVKAGIPSRSPIEFIPWEAMGGYILMLEPSDLIAEPTMAPEDFADEITEEITNPTREHVWR